jgi:hypothetical protein
MLKCLSTPDNGIKGKELVYLSYEKCLFRIKQKEELKKRL